MYVQQKCHPTFRIKSKTDSITTGIKKPINYLRNVGSYIFTFIIGYTGTSDTLCFRTHFGSS